MPLNDLSWNVASVSIHSQTIISFYIHDKCLEHLSEAHAVLTSNSGHEQDSVKKLPVILSTIVTISIYRKKTSFEDLNLLMKRKAANWAHNCRTLSAKWNISL